MRADVIVEIRNLQEGSLGVAKSFVLMAKNVGWKCAKVIENWQPKAKLVWSCTHFC
jgi:hypothetical protein